MTKKEISIVLGTVCAVLVFAIFVQLKTISNTNSTVPQSMTEDSLRDEVLTTKENYDRLYESVLREEKNLETIRKEVSENNDNAKETETKLKKINDILGLTDLTGQGIIVTLDDNKAASVDTIGVTEDISSYLVHYIDILKVINELWNADAEAISVNGERIVFTTAVTCIGNVVSINGEKVGAPFVINVIGDPEKLYGSLTRVESYLKILERDGVIVDVKKGTNISVPKYAGTYPVEYMKSK